MDRLMRSILGSIAPFGWHEASGPGMCPGRLRSHPPGRFYAIELLVLKAGRRGIAEAMRRTILINRGRLTNGRSCGVIDIALRAEDRAGIGLLESLFLSDLRFRHAHIRIFSIGSTGAKSDCKGSKSELFHFRIPLHPVPFRGIWPFKPFSGIRDFEVELN